MKVSQHRYKFNLWQLSLRSREQKSGPLNMTVHHDEGLERFLEGDGGRTHTAWATEV